MTNEARFTSVILAILQAQGYDVRRRRVKAIASALQKDNLLNSHISATAYEAELLIERCYGPLPRSRSGPAVKRKLLDAKARELEGGYDFSSIQFRLPNLVAGKNMSGSVRWEGDHCGSLEVLAKELDCGVSISRDGLHFHGSISDPGEHHINVPCQITMPSGTRHLLFIPLRVTVLPDPKTLWKSLPVDPGADYFKTNEDFRRVETHDFLVCGASIRGRSHAHKGSFREDDFEFEVATNGWAVLAVCDGAGSSEFSRKGSELVSSVAVKTLARALGGESGQQLEDLTLNADPHVDIKQLRECFRGNIVMASFEALRILEAEVDLREDRAVFKDFLTTLQLVACKRIDSDRHLVVAFGVGDGLIGALYDGKSVAVMNTPDSGPYAGQTHFLTADIFETGNAYDRVSFRVIPRLEALLLMTDGISDAFFPYDSSALQYDDWARLFSEIDGNLHETRDTEAQSAIFDWMTFWSDGNHDDRTFCLLKPKNRNYGDA